MWGDLSFTSPWVLGFMAVLPVLWWLIRLTPPTPRKIVFPALALLRDIAVQDQTPARTPWWLLLLRLVIATLIITAFAQPLMNPMQAVPGKGAYLIVVDNDWAAARDWPVRQDMLMNLAKQAEREDRRLIFLPTTPPADGMPLAALGPIDAKSARAAIEQLKPHPWPSDWAQADAVLQKLDRTTISDALWIASGVGNQHTQDFYDHLQQGGGVRVITTQSAIYSLSSPQTDGDTLSLFVRRAVTDAPATLTIDALARDGNVLARLPATFTAGAPRAVVPVDMSLELRNQISRFEIEGHISVATTALLDTGWEQRAVGVVGNKAEIDNHSLLSSLYYIDRALKPFADLHVETLDALLKQGIAVIILADTVIVNDDMVEPLRNWIKHGGMLIRFASAHLSTDLNPKEAELLPVTLRSGDRAMGGALSWATPQKLRDFPPNSPFHGLPIPDDVTVSRQVLAEPDDTLTDKTWAELADGTPLVSAKRLGQGVSVLFHVPAQSDWSNLPISGLFVDMLHRLVDMSRGGMAPAKQAFPDALPPLMTLDAFGADQQPAGTVQPLTMHTDDNVSIDPHHPPGLYGTTTASHALNLGNAIGQPVALEGVPTSALTNESAEVDLQPALLVMAFLLLLIDLVISLVMRGLLRLPTIRSTTALIAFALLITTSTADATDAKTAIELTSETYLAHLRTGDRELDRITEAGLHTLASALEQRTSMNHVGVAEVDPATDDLSFFALLYWPLKMGAEPLSPAGAANVNNYLHHGGMIVFDSMTGDDLPPVLIKHMLAGIDLPPLEPVPDNHVLKRSFYLLEEFPGRFNNGHVWLQPDTLSSYDGVSSVVYGSNGWAAAWATNANGEPLFPCVPGGEMQREHALRFGINLVMVALTGNYKSDQIHSQALLEKMGK